MKNKNIKFIYGNMDWWDVAEQPQGFDALPPEFIKAHGLWEASADRNFIEITQLLNPYIYGLFVANNLSDFDKMFVSEDFFEFPHVKLNISGVDFSECPLPRVKTEAIFSVTCAKEIEETFIEDCLEEKGSKLSDCVSFGWSVPNNEDLDLTFGDNQGVEACFVKSEGFLK